MRWRHLVVGMVALWLGIVAVVSAPKIDVSQEFFTNGIIPVIHIEVSGTNLVELRKDDRKYVSCTVKEGGKVYEEVGIHVKGAAGSKRDFGDRPALTLNFDKFNEGQKFHGMDKLHLNNSVQDPSYMTEILCGNLFLAAGVPTARGMHARVYLNDRDLGLYVLKEGFDREFLKRHFKNTRGNLYDGGFLREITEPLQKNSLRGTRDVKDYSDLKALAKAAEEPDPLKRMERLRQLLEVDQFITFIALEAMTWHWDGYLLKRNNYRVYHDPSTDKITFIPHGMDQMFWEPGAPVFFSHAEGLVAHAILQTTEGRQLYREKIADLLSNLFTTEKLTNEVNRIHARIRPVLASMNAGLGSEIDGQAERLRSLIVQRIANVRKQAQLPPPGGLKFGLDNVAQLTGWKDPEFENSGGTLDKVTEGGKSLLHIRAAGNEVCWASWRMTVVLPKGAYRFEGLVRTAGVAPERDEKGEGAGLRISGTKEPRVNKLSGTSVWQKLTFDFNVAPGEEEITLICELRASRGEAWFDAGSLKLMRK